jgi:hypothetical protein
MNCLYLKSPRSSYCQISNIKKAPLRTGLDADYSENPRSCRSPKGRNCSKVSLSKLKIILLFFVPVLVTGRTSLTYAADGAHVRCFVDTVKSESKSQPARVNGLPIIDGALLTEVRPIKEHGQDVPAAYRVTLAGNRRIFKPFDHNLSAQINEMRELSEFGGPKPLYATKARIDGVTYVGVVMEEIPGKTLDRLRRGEVDADALIAELKNLYAQLANHRPPLMLDDPNGGNFIVNILSNGKMIVRPLDQALVDMTRGEGWATPQYAQRQRDRSLQKLVNYIDREIRR